jgi:hypothetical protein
MGPAPTLAQIEESGGNGGSTGGNRYPDDARMQTKVEPPSTRYRYYDASGLVRVLIPSNWKEFGDGSSATFAPDGAYGNYQGESVFTHGAIVGVTRATSPRLREATDAYLSGILQSNSYLRADRNYSAATLDGREALRRRLTGTSNVTGRSEVVQVYTTMTDEGDLVFMIQVVPSDEARDYNRAFNDMTRSLKVLG